MEEAGYNITNKEFKQISKLAENVYNIAVIVDYCLVVGVKRARSRFSPLPTIRFVSNHPEIEECYNLAPVIKNLKDNADLINAFLLIMKNDFFIFTSP